MNKSPNGRRVVVTGAGVVSPIGNELDDVAEALKSGKSGVAPMPEWAEIKDLRTRIAAPVTGVDFSSYPRKRIRTMGRVGLLSLLATERAVADAGLSDEMLASPRVGLAYGSTHGSSSELERFTKVLAETGGLRGLAGSAYLKFMSHTCAGNLAQCFGIHGRVMPTVAACASASMGIGVGFEAVRAGQQDVMLCGGAEELHFVHAGVFDIMYATSVRYHDDPSKTPRPYDSQRDGLVVGEGAGTLVIEELEHALGRNATIHAEIIGFGTNCDGTHITSPSVDGMAGVMALALESAGIDAADIDYVNGHGTATDVGDICESQAMARVLGARVPVSSTKSYTGHTLGACGAIEAIFCLLMMRDGFLAPNRNLDEVDPRCAQLNYLRGDPVAVSPRTVMTNNFAFGGINTSIVLRRFEG